MSGGRGTVVGAMLGSLVIAVISSGIVQFGVSANWSMLVTEVISSRSGLIQQCEVVNNTVRDHESIKTGSGGAHVERDY